MPPRPLPAWRMVPAMSFASSLWLPTPDGSGCNSSIIPSSIHPSLTVNKHPKKLASAILEGAHKVSSPHCLLKDKANTYVKGPCLCVCSQARFLIYLTLLGLSSVASLIALSSFVPHKTRLISNQQTFPEPVSSRGWRESWGFAVGTGSGF